MDLIHFGNDEKVIFSLGFLCGITDEDKNYDVVENLLKTMLVGIISGFGSLFI